MSKVVQEYIKTINYILERGDISSDTYNNALSIKNIMEYLYDNGYLSEFEYNVLEKASEGYNISEIAKELNADRRRVSNSIKEGCNKIAFRLGGNFTDHGFVNNVAMKYAKDKKGREALKEFFGD